MPWGPNQCTKLRTFDEAMAKKIEANNIVFAVHIPLPNKEMSPWFQFMLVILQFDIAFKMYNQIGENQDFSYWFQTQVEDRTAHFSPPGHSFWRGRKVWPNVHMLIRGHTILHGTSVQRRKNIFCVFKFRWLAVPCKFLCYICVGIWGFVSTCINILSLISSQSKGKYLQKLNVAGQPLKYSPPLSLLITRIQVQSHSTNHFWYLFLIGPSPLDTTSQREPTEMCLFSRLDFCYTERQQTMMDVLLFVLYRPSGVCRGAC